MLICFCWYTHEFMLPFLSPLPFWLHTPPLVHMGIQLLVLMALCSFSYSVPNWLAQYNPFSYQSMILVLPMILHVLLLIRIAFNSGCIMSYTYLFWSQLCYAWLICLLKTHFMLVCRSLFLLYVCTVDSASTTYYLYLCVQAIVLGNFYEYSTM